MPSVDKIVKILELLRANHRSGLTNKEISAELEIPPSTCYRILGALKRHDLVYQRRPDLHYFLGFAHMRFAEAVLEGVDVAAVCLPYLEDLHLETDETTFFALLSGHSCVALECCGHINTRVAVGRGEVMPLHASAAGKAVLAFLGGREQAEVLKALEMPSYTNRTIADPAMLAGELAAIRETGVAFNYQEFHNGINAFAVPVFARQGRVIGAIAAVGTSVDLDRQSMEEYAEAFLEASEAISFKLGGSLPEAVLRSRYKRKETAQ